MQWLDYLGPARIKEKDFAQPRSSCQLQNSVRLPIVLTLCSPIGPVELAPAAAGVDLKAFVLPFSAKSLHPRGPTPSRGLEPANLTRLLPTPSSHESRDLIFTFQIPPTTSIDSKSTSSVSGVDDKLITNCHREAPSPYEAFSPRAIYAALLRRRTLPIRDWRALRELPTSAD